MVQNLLKKIAQKLDKSHISYMIIGGQAVLIYGEPRLTKDIDITLDADIDKYNEIKKIVNSLKLKVLVRNINNFLKKTMVLPVLDEKSGIRIDFIFSFSAYEKQAIKRTNNLKFGNTTIKFASLEDVIIHKIIAGRPRDIEDVKSILLKNPDFDKKYISKWLKEFDKSAVTGENYFETFNRIMKEIK